MHARFLALRIRWQQIEAWNMVPIITREGIEAFRAMPVTVATKKNARLRSAPAQRQAWRRSDLRCAAIRSVVVDGASTVIETHKLAGDFREWRLAFCLAPVCLLIAPRRNASGAFTKDREKGGSGPRRRRLAIRNVERVLAPRRRCGRRETSNRSIPGGA